MTANLTTGQTLSLHRSQKWHRLQKEEDLIQFVRHFNQVAGNQDDPEKTRQIVQLSLAHGKVFVLGEAQKSWLAGFALTSLCHSPWYARFQSTHPEFNIPDTELCGDINFVFLTPEARKRHLSSRLWIKIWQVAKKTHFTHFNFVCDEAKTGLVQLYRKFRVPEKARLKMPNHPTPFLVWTVSKRRFQMLPALYAMDLLRRRFGHLQA